MKATRSTPPNRQVRSHTSPHTKSNFISGVGLRFVFYSLLALITSIARAVPPVVSGVTASQRSGTQLVDIYYNVSDADGNGPLTVYVAISDNGGASYNVPVFTTSGAVGPGVVPGNARHIVWNAGTDWPGRFNDQCKVKIIADDGTAPPAPTDMVYIPAGAFQMGDNLDGDISAMPVHTVYVSAFFMDKYEVRKELYQTVYAWALGNGYSLNLGGSEASDRPIQFVNWHDAIIWCNARSQMEGLTPVYYYDLSHTDVYTGAGGLTGLTSAQVKWDANGYRLPTEAEWEKAARGGLTGIRYPNGNSISCSDANYSGCVGNTRPGGSYVANGYGLYDMAGNLWEWCWDWYDNAWYGKAGAIADNTRGPSSALSRRLLRGGAWNYSASDMRCATRRFSTPFDTSVDIGFRCVRGLTP